MKINVLKMTALLALASVSAYAGPDSKDMKMSVAPTPPPSDEGFYVAAYGGAQFATDYGNERRNLALGGGNVDVPSPTTQDDWGGAGGIKVGYNFESYDICEGFRLQPAVEGEGLYLGTTSRATSAIPLAENTSYNSAAWFVNGIVRFKFDFPVKPYIGLGVGGQYITTHSEFSPNGIPLHVTGMNGDDVDFAFQALAGFDYEVCPHWVLFTEYKFIDALGTDIKYTNVGGVSGLDYRFKPDQIQQHLITAGVKYNF